MAAELQDVSLAVAKPPATPRGADGEKLRAFTRPDGTVAYAYDDNDADPEFDRVLDQMTEEAERVRNEAAVVPTTLWGKVLRTYGMLATRAVLENAGEATANFFGFTEPYFEDEIFEAEKEQEREEEEARYLESTGWTDSDPPPPVPTPGSAATMARFGITMPTPAPAAPQASDV